MPLSSGEQVYRSYHSVLRNADPWRRLKLAKYRRITAEVLDRSEQLRDVSEMELKQLAASYRQEAINGRPLDSLLVPTFALVRETGRRVLNMAHFPVQIMGGIGLHHGHIVEMATGEGKTLVSTLPAFLNALTDRGVHIVTVNDYLANRDAEEMGQIHRFLGLTVGVITTDTQPHQRIAEYRKSITYATNKELGFDYLRDQIRKKPRGWFNFGKTIAHLGTQQVQRPDFHFAIVDEADSVLIDEARTPLIIADSPAADDDVVMEFQLADKVASQLIEDIDYSYDRSERRVEWLKDGEQRVTRLLGGKRSLSGHRIDWHESCLRAVKAQVLFHRDVDYVVDGDEVVIVDESTGRKMPGRQWEEGLHQAVAAKEGIKIKGQTETLARTTYQIFFNRYEKLSGMTGTVITDANEIAQIYRIGSIRIPTNRPCIRKTFPDRIYGTEARKWEAVVEEVRSMLDKGRPVLVGTRSIEKSELLSRLLEEAGIEHVVLNARHEEQEAAIVAEAGRPGRVTVATNMAGRGTDIKLPPGVADAGGLHVIGTERHENRRIDNQLVGRAGRQGDPGSAEFFVSIEDPLIKRYRPQKSARLAQKYAELKKPLTGATIRRFFRNVQRSIERQHRKIRFDLIKYDRERTKYNRQIGTE